MISRQIAAKKKGYLLLAGILLLLISCKPTDKPSDLTGFKGFVRPDHFPTPVYAFDKNQLTQEGFELGRKLFYDPILSRDSSISCASCHNQSAGFSDPGKAFSTGVNGKSGKRNSPALANLAWYPSFMADGGINHIEVMPIAPITDSLEMNESLANLLEKLNSDENYQKLFNKAFGISEITDQKLLYALAQFMGMMISADSKYDNYLKGETKFTDSELRGYKLFQQNCASCHSGPLLTNFSFKNNGLDLNAEDPGRERVTLNAQDHGKFRVPNLRNVELTYPYMHDGRFATLSEVIDHYTDGIQPTASLADELQTPIVLTKSEKEDLLKFLTTLTDYNYITNPMFAQGGQNL